MKQRLCANPSHVLSAIPGNKSQREKWEKLGFYMRPQRNSDAIALLLRSVLSKALEDLIAS